MGADFDAWLRKSSEEIRRRDGDAFNLVVIGDFKRGKSTLVNAILRGDVVHTNVTPETVTINRVSYGEEESARAVLSNGRKIALSIEETKRDRLDGILARLPAEVSYIDIKIPNEALKDIRIVDTPGVGDILKRFDAQVSDYIRLADAIIYVVSALSPLSETEQAFLCAAIQPRDISKLFVVINMCDALDGPEEVERIKKLITERIGRIFPENYVCAVSALDEFCRVKGRDRPNPALAPVLESAFAELSETLESEVFDKREVIRLERETAMLRLLFAQAGAKIAMLESALEIESGRHADALSDYENESGALAKELENQKRKIHSEIKEMRGEASEWMHEFMERLAEEVESARTYSLEILEKNFHFYMIDVIRAAIMQCTETHQHRISGIIHAGLDAAWGESSQRAVSRKIASAYQGIVWTGFDAASMVLVTMEQAVPQLGLLTLIGRTIVGFGKSAKSGKVRTSFIETVISHYGEIADSVMESVKKTYAEFDIFADETLENSYRSRLEESVAAVKQASEIAAMNEAERKEVSSSLEALKGSFGALLARFAG
jgi:GTPase SAR1 family protein